MGKTRKYPTLEKVFMKLAALSTEKQFANKSEHAVTL
jgi:hypothetical protein